LKQRVTGPVKGLARRLGYDIVRLKPNESFPLDYDEEFISLFQKVQPYTLTSHERVFALRQAVTYLIRAGIEGAFVECGVWRGGSMLVVAETLLAAGVTDRDLYLFDTFTTMPPPNEEDVDVWGQRAADYYEAAIAEPFYAYEQDEVRTLLLRTGYPEARLHFVKGMVEDNIPGQAPPQIALCRLDTDWYVSTAHELRHLFPRIPEGGILLVDDYGHFQGARQAVDEYLEERGISVLLNRIDYSGRLAVVTRRVRDRLIEKRQSQQA
jgi:hypothetical protein